MYQLKRSLCHAGLLFTALFLNLAKGSANDTSIELLDFNQSDSTSGCIIGLLDKYDKISLTTILKNFELRDGGASIEFKLFIADDSTKTHKTDGLIIYRFSFNCSGRMRYETSCKVVSSGHYEIIFHISVAYTMSRALIQTVIHNTGKKYESNKIQLPTVYDPSQINFYVNDVMLSPKECEIKLTKSRNITLCFGEYAPTSTLATIYQNDKMVAQSEKCVSYTDKSSESFQIFRFECNICDTIIHEITCYYLSAPVQEDRTKKNSILPGPEDISDHTIGMDKVALIFITLTSCMIAIIVVVTVQCFCNKHYAVIKARCFSNTNKAANGASKEQDDSGKKLHRNEKYNKMNPKASSKPLLNKVTETFSRHKENDKESMSIELSPLDIKLVCKPRINKELSSESTLIEYISPETKENVCNKPIDRESSVELISIEELSAETKAMMSPADKNDQEILTKAEMITDTSAKIKLKLKESNTYVTLAAKPAFNYGHVISLADERRARQSGYENYMISKNTYVYEKFIYGKKDADELKTAIDNSPMPITEEMFPLGIEVTNDFEKERLSKLRACLSADIEKIYLYDTLEKSEKDFLKYFLDKDEHSYDLIVQLKRFLSKRQILE